MDAELILAQAKAFKAIPEFKSLKSRQRQFILAYAKTFSVLEAQKLTGISCWTHYSWRKDSAEYKQAFELAREIAGDFGEGDIYQRAFVGTDVTRIKLSKGELVTENSKQKSDILAMFMLKGIKPQYRDNWQINTFVGPQSLNIGYSKPLPELDITPKKDNDSK